MNPFRRRPASKEVLRQLETAIVDDLATRSSSGDKRYDAGWWDGVSKVLERIHTLANATHR